MNSWESVEQIFLAVADLSEAERESFLNSACKDNPALRTEVEQLLMADTDHGETINSLIRNEAALLLHEQTLAGKRVGSYRVMREIGHGGMGIVYLGHRDDEQYSKQVAIKVVKRGMDTADVLDRFRYERQILANLDHPYIARLVDAGTTPDGRPYFVMEYIEGEPVDLYCRIHELDNKARCNLFLRILEAVSYAHRNLVIHRDLKPGNIFVTAGGAPKLLDFGVAKLLNRDATASGSSTTTMGLRPLTPEYASPEQVLGLTVTTATDIYSLGLVLYELLTGKVAQPVKSSTPLEVKHVVCDVEVSRPRLLAKDIDTELENIVLMALRKEPERRYQTVDQFAEDIRRYLSGRPIRAQRDSFLYRSRKFVVRNRVYVALAAVIFLSLIGGLVVSIQQSRRANAALRVAESQRAIADAERTRAEAESRRAEAALAAEASQRKIADEQRDEAVQLQQRVEAGNSDLIELSNHALLDVHDKISALPGSMDARRALVNSTLDYLQRLQRTNGLDDKTRSVLSEAYYRVAMIQGDPFGPSLEDFEASRISLEKSAALLAPIYKQKSDDPLVLEKWLKIKTAEADILERSGKSEDAIAAYLKLLPTAHHLGEIRPMEWEACHWEGVIENSMALILRNNDPVRSLKYANLAIDSTRALLARFPENGNLQQSLGAGLATAGAGYGLTGDLQKAADYYQQSIQIREEILAKEPNNLTTKRNLLVAYGNYASVLGIEWTPNLGKPVEARIASARSVELARQLVAADPQDATARYDLAVSLARQGMIDPEANPEAIKHALASLDEALGIFEPIMHGNTKFGGMAVQYAMALEYAGHRLEQLGQPEDAEKRYQQSLAQVEPFLTNVNNSIASEVMRDREFLALLHAAKGERAQARELANSALTLSEQVEVPLPETKMGRVAVANFTCGRVAYMAGDFAQAQKYVEKALAIWGGLHNPGILSIHRKSIADAQALLQKIKAQLPAATP